MGAKCACIPSPFQASHAARGGRRTCGRLGKLPDQGRERTVHLGQSCLTSMSYAHVTRHMVENAKIAGKRR